MHLPADVILDGKIETALEGKEFAIPWVDEDTREAVDDTKELHEVLVDALMDRLREDMSGLSSFLL